MKGSKVLFFTLVAACGYMAILPSCKDKTGPCEAVITVTDSSGNRVSAAKVTLRPDSSVYVSTPPRPVDPTVTQTGTTDASGQVTFSYKLESVLIIDASKGIKTGRDYIRLEQNSSVSKTVIIH